MIKYTVLVTYPFEYPEEIDYWAEDSELALEEARREHPEAICIELEEGSFDT